ncbi:MAG: hypothetical protein WD342_10070 [Verrucomicrobiales bacterium]
MLHHFVAFAALSATFFAVSMDPVRASETLVADLDALIALPEAYGLKPEDLEAKYEQGDWRKNPYFKWLRADKSRAIFQRKDFAELKVDLTMLDGTVPVEEAIVDFEDGNFLGVTVSIFNRGDGGSISAEDFQERFRSMGRHLGEQLDVRPVRRKAKPTQGLLTSGWIWISARGKAVLEHNPEAPENTEFLRMRLAQRDAGGAYEAATRARAGATVKLSELPANVVRDGDGNVYVEDLPMVDQGFKGYCVVASAQRLFEYYGIPADMHQLAQIAGSDPNRGTSPIEINRELGAIDHLFKTRFECLAVRDGSGLVELVDGRYVGDPVPDEAFHKTVRKSIDEGIPLLWALEVGRFAEDPPLFSETEGDSVQTGGGHMRMIIGYNDETNRLIFSDSWGAGHEFKTMDADEALQATHGLFLLKPTTR